MAKTVTNTASMEGTQGGQFSYATSNTVTYSIVDRALAGVTLDKSPDLIENMIPGVWYEISLLVKNSGAPVTNIVVRDAINNNLSYINDTTTIDGVPAESVRYEGGTLTVTVPGELASGAETEIKFQLTPKE